VYGPTGIIGGSSAKGGSSSIASSKTGSGTSPPQIATP
jgi:hypothetical protein